MKRFFLGLLTVLFCLSLAACGQTHQAQEADAAIEALFPITLKSESAILSAEQQVAALTEKEQGSLKNLQLLRQARENFTDLSNADAAKKIEAMINAIGTVTLESKPLIEKAQSTFQSAQMDVRALVANRAVLDAAVKTLSDLQIGEVEALIDSIGEVTMDSKPLLDEASAAFAALSETQQAAVSNQSVLEDAVSRYVEVELNTMWQAALESGRDRLRVIQLECSQPDTAGGVELYFNFINNYPSTISKIDFGVSFYGEDGNMVMCRYQQKQVYNCTVSGSYAQWERRYDDGWYWGDFYTQKPVTPKLVSLTITYANGETYTMNPLELEAIIY